MPRKAEQSLIDALKRCEVDYVTGNIQVSQELFADLIFNLRFR